VSVVRVKPRHTDGGQADAGLPLKFHIDPLPTSMYAIRVVGAIERKDVTDFPKNLIVELKVNDGPNGEVSDYVLRNRGSADFYCVGEFYIHVNDGRAFDAEVGLHADSEVELLVHNVDVHDALGECAKRAGKTASILASPDKLKGYWKADPETKLKPLREGKWVDVLGPDAAAGIANGLRARNPGKTNDELLAI
jgi:hypothetical protein